jgi:hypothetical protein
MAFPARCQADVRAGTALTSAPFLGQTASGYARFAAAPQRRRAILGRVRTRGGVRVHQLVTRLYALHARAGLALGG